MAACSSPACSGGAEAHQQTHTTHPNNGVTTSSARSTPPPLLRFGIIGWSEPSLQKCGRFFPPNCRTGPQRLRHCASKFPCLEVDTSHYAIPTERVVGEWLRTTREFAGFKFHVKVFGMFTMRRVPFGTLPYQVRNLMLAVRSFQSQAQIRWEDLTAEAKRVLWEVQNQRLRVLSDAGRLGCVVFQFQLDFSPSDAARAWISYCRRNLGADFKMAVEFRARSWYCLLYTSPSPRDRG